MKLNTEDIEDYEVEQIGELKGSGKVGINTEDMSFFFQMMSSSIYSNPKGSIIREITSNCFDAHQEIGVKEPVIIGYENQEGNLFMTFEDFGVGISPERFEKIYLKYLSSSKRESNEQMGYFGLGSKSPFAYADLFYIRTRYDSTEYLYIMSKGQNGIPDWDLMMTNPTTERNGTQIKFLIEGGRYGEDFFEFKKEIESQLRYFDDVYVKGFDINNEYTILDYRTFKFRPDTRETSMHIALGKVTYPIDWDAIGRDLIGIPVGVKFDIGELVITPNRESIRYTKEMIELINLKIDGCLKELKKMTNNRYDTIEDVLKVKADSTKYLSTGEGKGIPVYSSYYTNDKGQRVNGYVFKIPSPRWKELDYPIEIPDNPYFMFRVMGYVINGSYIPIGEGKANKKLPSHPENIFYNMKDFPIYRTNDFKSIIMKNKFINNGMIVTKKKKVLSEILKEIKVTKERKSKFGTYTKKELYNPLYVHRENQLKVSYVLPLIGEGYNKVTIIKEYKKKLTQELVSKSKSYDSLVIPQDFIDANRKKVVRKLSTDSELSYYLMDEGNPPKRTSPRIAFNKCLTVYGTNKLKPYLYAVFNIMCMRRIKRNSYPIRFIAINKTDLDSMKEEENKVDLQSFVTSRDANGNRAFREQATAHFLYRKWRNLNLSFAFDYVPSVKKYVIELNEFMNKTLGGANHTIQTTLDSKFVQEILEMAKEEKILIQDWIDRLDMLEVVQEDLSPISTILDERGITDRHKRSIAKFLISKGYPVNRDYVYTPTELENKWKEVHERVENRMRTLLVVEKEDNENQVVLINLKTVKCPRTNFLKLSPSKLERISMLQLRVTQN